MEVRRLSQRILVAFRNISLLKTGASTQVSKGTRSRTGLVFITTMMLIATVTSSALAFIPTQSAFAVTAADCAEGEFVASSSTNQGAAYCFGPVTCANSGGTYDTKTNVCTSVTKTGVSSMSLEKRTLSYVTLNALRSCMKSAYVADAVDSDSAGTNARTSIDNAKKGNWWRDSYDFVTTGDAYKVPGSYVNSKTPTGEGEEGKLNCNTVLKTGVETWGYTDALELLCDAGVKRYNGGSCEKGTDNYFGQLGPAEAELVYTAVKNKVYGGEVPSLNEKVPGKTKDGGMGYPGRYLLYSKAFLRGCKAYVNKDATSGFAYKDVKIVNKDGTLPDPLKTYEGIGTGDQRFVYVDRDNLNWVKLSCADIAKEVNTYASDYQLYAVKNPAETEAIDLEPGVSDEDSADVGGTSCVIESIGWLVCGVMGAISGVVDGLYGLIQSILIVNPLSQTNDDGTVSAQYSTWQNIRNIANVLLVIGFIIIIFSQLTGLGVSNYGIKKLLPRIIIVAIAINLSYIVMSAAIDVTNIVGVGIKQILDTTGADAALESVSFQALSDAYLTGATTLAVGAGIGIIAIGAAGLSASALALMALPFILGALLAVLAAFATMFIRNALIIVLVIIAPVAFAAYLLPNTQSLFDRWRKLLVSMLVLFPMAALLFGGARLAAYIIISSGQSLAVLIALFVMAAPLGALPFLIRSSNSILSGIGNKLQGAAKAARSATQRGLKPFVDKQRSQYKSGARNFLGMRQQPGSRRNLAQGFDQRRRSRALETANADTDAEENWKEAGLAGANGAGRRAQRALDTQKTLGNRKTANDAQIDERLKRRIETPGTADANYEARAFDAQRGSAAADAVTKQRNLGRVQQNIASTSAAANGETLGTINRRQYGAEEASKTIELATKRANMASGVANADVQAQKTEELGIKAIEAEEQAEFDVSIPHNNDTMDSVQRVDVANRESGAAAAETKQMLEEQAQMSPELAELDLRKRTAEDAKGVIEKSNQATYDEQRDETLATEARVASSRIAAAGREEEQTYAANLQSDADLARRAGGVDPEGETLVVAQAIETQRKAYDSNVAAYGVRLRDAGTADSIATPGRPDRAGDDSLMGLVMDSGRTVAEREAAGRGVVNGGNIDAISAYGDYLASALANTAPDTQEYKDIQALQKAYGETVEKSPGKPMGVGAAEVAQYKTGTYKPPMPSIPSPIDTSGLSVTAIQTLNTVAEKGVSMDGWASMDKSDIDRIADLAERGLIPPERLDTMWESLNTAMSDVRWYGRIKEREQARLEALMTPDSATGRSKIPTPAGKSRTPRK